MNSRSVFVNVIRWIARISGTLIIVFVLFFLLMDLFKNEESLVEELKSASEVIAFICFPLSTIIGLTVAFKWEGLGGLISTVGFVCLLFVRPDLSSSLLMMSLVIPCLLYIIYWIMTRKPN